MLRRQSIVKKSGSYWVGYYVNHIYLDILFWGGDRWYNDARAFFSENKETRFLSPGGDRWHKSSRIYVAIASTLTRNRARDSLIALAPNMEASNMGCR